MIASILTALTTASLSILGKVLGAKFFEAVLIKIVLWSGEKLVGMTSNKLDNQIFDEVRKALSSSADQVYLSDIAIDNMIEVAASSKDYAEVARLMNLKGAK